MLGLNFIYIVIIAYKLSSSLINLKPVYKSGMHEQKLSRNKIKEYILGRFSTCVKEKRKEGKNKRTNEWMDRRTDDGPILYCKLTIFNIGSGELHIRKFLHGFTDSILQVRKTTQKYIDTE